MLDTLMTATLVLYLTRQQAPGIFSGVTWMSEADFRDALVSFSLDLIRVSVDILVSLS